MPTIPVLEPRVATAPLPGVRLSPDAPTGAFQPPQPTDLSGVAAIVQRERQKADQVAVLDADNQLSDLGLSLTRDALSRRGKDAMGATADVTATWQRDAGEIENTLVGDQKLAFRERAMARYATLRDTVERHADSEARSYDDQTTNAALVNRMNDALTNAGDPDKVAGAIAEQRAIVTDWAQRNGMGPEALQEKLAAVTSTTHLRVLDQLSAGNQNLAAKDYYDAHKDAFQGTDLIQATKVVKESSVRGASQTASDNILFGKDGSAPAATITDAMTRVRDIADPDVRDHTELRVRQYFTEQREAQRQAREDLMQQGTNLVERTHSFASLPPAMVTQLTVGERESLRSYAEKLQGGVPVKTDMATWYSLRTLASSDATRDQFLRTNLLQYRGALSDADFKELAGVQAGLRKGDQTESDKLASWNIGRGQILSSLNAIGIVPTEKDKHSMQQVADFTRQVQDQESAFVERTGKKPGVEDRQSIIDALLTHGIVTHTGTFWDSHTDKRVFELQPGEGLQIQSRDVPPGERALIIQALQLQQMPVTENAILERYRARLSRMVPLGVPGAR